MPPTTFAELGPRQRCIYDSFTKATGIAGAHLGSEVNAAGIDADETEAVLILAKRHGFAQTPRGCTGKAFKAMVAGLEEATEFIVLVCTGMGGSMIPATSRAGAAYSYDFSKGFDARRMFTDPDFDEILWHAIWLRADAGGRNKSVHDPQKMRPTGPVDGDRIIWMAR
ncbi:hypothetical protein [Mangrovicoccus ximenensis]|uniref:hypothetical protein n=1 Tax=Mangrovicoccus ximenensis TaxID=1911570 RepID=UPI000D3B0DDB|nr:hypothetical protein [Mangrovicoccus ximenensis]